MQNKKFFVGLSSMDYFGTYDDFNYICNKYNNIIDTWYIPPPFGKVYQNRGNTLTVPTLSNIQEIKTCFKIIKDNNQKKQFAFNSQALLNMKISYSQEILENCLNLFGSPDSLVCLDYLLPLFSQYNIPLSYSFNNYYPNTKLKNLKYCDIIVLGGAVDLRNFQFMKKLKEKYNNIKIELLINNGCHEYCNRECWQCSDRFLNIPNVKENNYKEIIAKQIIFPSELKYYSDNLIDYLKISSRPCSKEYLDWELYHFSNQTSIYDIMQILDLTKAKNWYYLGRLVPLIEWLKQFEPLDVYGIIETKKQQLEKIFNITNIRL